MGLKYLLRRHPDVSGDMLRTQIVRVNLVLANRVMDTERVENTHGVGFHKPLLTTPSLSPASNRILS
jgi:hypothetical protein